MKTKEDILQEKATTELRILKENGFSTGNLERAMDAFAQQESNLVENRVIKPNGELSEQEKSLILWFMELAVKMKMKDYTELSIASIDLDAWYEDYYKENELPLNALEMDEREGM